MSSPLPAGSTTKTTTRSLFALALRAWNLCVLLVSAAALLLVSPAAVAILLPVACMLVSACLVCAITARILLPFFCAPPPDWWASDDEQRSGGVRDRKKQDCVEVDRAEAPGCFDDDDDVYSAEEGHRGDGAEQEHGTAGLSSLDEEVSDRCDDDEQRRFYFVGTGRGSYYRTVQFYDLLAFWRSIEREATGNAQTYKVN